MPKREYGREGAYLQSKALKRILLWAGLPLLGCVILLLVLTTRLSPCVALPLLLLVPVAPGLAKIWERAADRAVDPWLKGYRGERDVADALRACVGNDGYLVHDLDFGRGNVDHVAVTPAGIFTIETKAYTGSAWTRGDRLYVNRVDHERDLKQAFSEACAVRDYLNRVSVGREHSVTPLLVLTAAKTKAYCKCRGVFVTHVDRLGEYMASDQQVLTALQRSAIAAALSVKTASR
jgi:hypothetical protein